MSSDGQRKHFISGLRISRIVKKFKIVYFAPYHDMEEIFKEKGREGRDEENKYQIFKRGTTGKIFCPILFRFFIFF